MGLFDEVYDQDDELDAKDDDDKNRLFETHQKTTRSIGQYLKLLLIVAVFVLIAGGAIFYFTLPGKGDQVAEPKGLADDVRVYFVDKVKRDVKTMTVFYCETSYWVRVEVELRKDIPGQAADPITKYKANAVEGADGRWSVTASPITSPEGDVPCSQ